MAVRQAVVSDLEDLAQIVIASSDDDPCYPYRFPFKGQYPSQYEEHCRRKCLEYLSTNTVIVYEVTNVHHKKVVAFSVWDQPKPRTPKSKRSQTWPRWSTSLSPGKIHDRHQEPVRGQVHNPPGDRPQSHPKHLARTPSHSKLFAREDRAAAFRDASKVARTAFFDYAQLTGTMGCGGGYMFLKILLCHPDHRRRGAGTALVRWGIAVAHVAGVATALFSSPMGAPLYHRLGFREVGRFEVAVEGDAERLVIPAMVLPTPTPSPSPSPSRRGSCAAEAAPGGLRKCVTNNVVVGEV